MGLVVHPRVQRKAAFLEPGLGIGVVEIVERALGGDDLGAQFLEDLQAIDVIGVIVGHEHLDNGLVGHPADLLEQHGSQGRGAQGIDDDHALIGDHDAGIGYEPLVLDGRAGGALNVIGVRRDLFQRHLHRSRRVALEDGGQILGVGDGVRGQQHKQGTGGKQGLHGSHAHKLRKTN